jgi:hypothetical protein
MSKEGFELYVSSHRFNSYRLHCKPKIKKRKEEEQQLVTFCRLKKAIINKFVKYFWIPK